MRLAVDEAAIRRGWVWPIRPFSPRPSSRQIFGSWVVLPEPVSPQTMMTWFSVSALAISLAAAGDRQVFGEGDRRQRRCARAMRARGLARRARGRAFARARSRCGRPSPCGRAATILSAFVGMRALASRLVSSAPSRVCVRRAQLSLTPRFGGLDSGDARAGPAKACYSVQTLFLQGIWCASRAANYNAANGKPYPIRPVAALRRAVHSCLRGKTFVVAFPGELVAAGALPVLAQDLSLLVASASAS
jgi:hypothetical protein